jgi:hypothetical protein
VPTEPPPPQQQQHSAEVAPVSAGPRSTSKNAAGVVVCTALPTPAPCGSVGFLRTAGRHSSSTMGGPYVLPDAVTATATVPPAASAGLAAVAPAAGLGERSASSTVQKWLLVSTHHTALLAPLYAMTKGCVASAFAISTCEITVAGQCVCAMTLQLLRMAFLTATADLTVPSVA